MIQKVADTLLKGMEIYLTEVGKYLDIIELPADDYANLRPIISPKTFDRYFSPHWKKMIDMIHEAAPGCKVLFHSNGNVEPFISRFSLLGVDILHGLDPSSGMDLKQLKRDYGNTISFSGGFSFDEMTSWDEQKISDQVHVTINTLGNNGGYLLSPSRHLCNQVDPNTIADFFRYGRWHGRYPLE